jgi:diaminohydroxyphosphoribosylaminopyrimidine deaminase/5-amino-6-(5-phosphoribosylamino)uracil reductase
VPDPTTAGILLPEAVYWRALEVGRRSAGVSGPNPPVGCVLVRDGHIVGEGATAAVGGPHAEVVALSAAGAAAQGAVAVVTLEPCAHHGRTPPCTDALVAAGVTAVHVLLRDPDPVAAGGAARLAQASVTVVDVGHVRPDLRAAATYDLRGFLARVKHGRPHVTLKLAQAVDGSVASPEGGYLTGEDARRHVHRLRAMSDAVLVGSGTIQSDDPALDVRFEAVDRQPRAVVVASTADVAARARVVRSGTIVVVGPAARLERRTALERAGVTVTTVSIAADGRGLDVTEVLAALLDQRVLTVLAEPGPRLAAALLGAGVVDDVELHVAGGATTSDPLRAALPALLPMLTDGTVGVERRMTADGDLILCASAHVLQQGDATAAGLAEVA